jgi:uncharacterized membrane protein (UPF0136 family)
MTKARGSGLLLLLLSSGIFIVWGSSVTRSTPAALADFKAVYYGARCIMEHSDPYKESEFLHVYRAEGGNFPSDLNILQSFNRAVPVCINLPTSLFLIAPFAMLPWGAAYVLWMIFTIGSLMLAAYLMWNLGANHAPVLSGCLIGFLLTNSITLLSGGNTAGIVVSLCVVAVWCFLKERFVLAGVFCMAVSLAIKPHDGGLVWLFFLLAGGVYRKHALQIFALTVALGLASILWVSHVAPHWMQELQCNLSAISAHGDLNDPGPGSANFRRLNMVVDLQSVISIFRDDPRIYNPASYLICGALLLAGAVRTLRSRFSQRSAWLALAAIAALSILPVYHRVYDSKLLILAVPACAMLWAEGGPIGWVALVVTTAGIVLTGDVPQALLLPLAYPSRLCAAGIFAWIPTVVSMRPVPLILLAIGMFYLWVYLRRAGPSSLTEPEGSAREPSATRTA